MSAEEVKKKAKAAEGKTAKVEKKNKNADKSKEKKESKEKEKVKVKKRKIKGASKRLVLKKKVKKKKAGLRKHPAKGSKAGEGKKEGVKKEKKTKANKSDEQKETEKVKEKIAKKVRASFKGRFGARSVRNVSKKKWQKWRLPHGIDIKKKREQGIWPSTGYRTRKDVREMHPSGSEVVKVNNATELAAIPEGSTVVVGATVGKRKRIEIVKGAAKRNVKLLNAHRG